jgi:hypothetical protein
LKRLDSGFRRNDGKGAFPTYCTSIKFDELSAFVVPDGFLGQLIDSVMEIIATLNERCFFMAAVLQSYSGKNCIGATLQGSK